MENLKIIRRSKDPQELSVVITPKARYTVKRIAGFYLPEQIDGVFHIIPNGVKFEVTELTPEEFKQYENKLNIYIVQTDEINPDFHAIKLNIDLKIYARAEYLLNRY